MTDTKVETIKVGTAVDARSDEERRAAAPVSLPAGSYDGAVLSSELDAAGDDANRDKIVSDLNQTDLPADSLGVPPGYKRVQVENTDLGITEQRVVFDESQRDAAAQAASVPTALQPGSAPSTPNFDRSPIDNTIPGVTSAIAKIDDVAHLNALREAEVAGQNRDGALAAIDSRITAVQGGSSNEGE